MNELKVRVRMSVIVSARASARMTVNVDVRTRVAMKVKVQCGRGAELLPAAPPPSRHNLQRCRPPRHLPSH